MRFPVLFISICLLLLTACGGQKGSAKLKVTSGFSTHNGNYNGGLFIHGQKVGSTEEFSFALNSETTASLELSFGSWNIRAVGWSSTTSENTGPMKGDVYCGSKSFDFKSDGSISIYLTKEQCHNDLFASSEFWDSGTGGISLKTTRIHPCGALYDLNDPTKLRTSLHPSYCSEYPEAFQMKPRGMKIILNSSGNLNSGVLSSTCVPLTKNTQSVEGFYHQRKLPSRIPITLKFYQSLNCDEQTLMRDNYFRQGLDHTLARREQEFDAILFKGDSTYPEPMLAVAFPLSGRGTTSLIKEMPEFKCNPQTGANSYAVTPQICFQFPNLPYDSSNNQVKFVLQPGYNSIQLPAATICDANTTITSTDGKITKIKCEESEKGTLLHLNLEPMTDGSFETFSLINVQNATTYATTNTTTYPTTYATTDATTYPTTYNVFIKNEIYHYDQLRRILGLRNPNSELMNSFRNEEDRLGILGKVSELFSPAMIGGLFWDLPCSENNLYYPTNRWVNLWDEGKRKEYQITLLPLNASGLMRRITVRQINIPLNEMDGMNLDFQCTTATQPFKIGRIEERRNEFRNGGIREEKSLIIWNTKDDAFTSAFEEYRIESQTDASSTMLYQRSSFTRAKKFGQDSSKIEILNYNYNKHSGTSQENVHFNEYDVVGNRFTSRAHPPIHVQNGNAGDIFTDNINLIEKNQIRSGMETAQISKKLWSMTTLQPTAGEAGVYLYTTPYIKPHVENFEINYISLDPNTMRTTIFNSPF